MGSSPICRWRSSCWRQRDGLTQGLRYFAGPRQIPEQRVEADPQARIGLPAVLAIPISRWARWTRTASDSTLAVCRKYRLRNTTRHPYPRRLPRTRTPSRGQCRWPSGTSRSGQAHEFLRVRIHDRLRPFCLVAAVQPFCVGGRPQQVAPGPAIEGGARCSPQAILGFRKQLGQGIEVPCAELVFARPLQRSEGYGRRIDSYADVEIQKSQHRIPQSSPQAGVSAGCVGDSSSRCCCNKQAQPLFDIGQGECDLQVRIQREVHASLRSMASRVVPMRNGDAGTGSSGRSFAANLWSVASTPLCIHV